MEAFNFFARLVNAKTAEEFIICLRLVLTAVYAYDEAEPIVQAVSKAILSDLSSTERMVHNSSNPDQMADTVACLAIRGGCLRGNDQLQLAFIFGIKGINEMVAAV